MSSIAIDRQNLMRERIFDIGLMGKILFQS